MMIELLGMVLLAAGLVNLAAALLSIVVSRPFGHPLPVAGPPALVSVRAPFVSVHVAIHDEPPAMVIATIEALLRSAYAAFEVIVIDNNTADPAVWQPVARRAEELGPRVRFQHHDGVRGAKAGALNIALAMTDQRAEYVAIVDADYQVAPDFLARGVAACGPTVEFVQFPQVYREAGAATAVVAELADYFETFPRAANRAQSALLTGTLSVISIEALRAVGGWPTRSITEDAELGVALWSSGARGLYIPSTVGDGLLPVDLAGLRLQRHRWVAGNFQTLLGARKTIRANGVGAFAVVAQLTAWIGLLALPLFSLVAVAAVRLGDGGLSVWPWHLVEGVAVATLLGVLMSHLVRALNRQRFGSIAVTMSLLWTSSFAWLSALGWRPPRFRRTPKIAGAPAGGVSLDTIGSSVALATALLFLLEGVPLTAITLALSATGLIAAPLVDRWLRRAAADRGRACAA